jgi:hypothetical protein
MDACRPPPSGPRRMPAWLVILLVVLGLAALAGLATFVMFLYVMSGAGMKA